MRITALHPDRRVPSHLVIEVDGARFASLPAEQIRALGVERGQDLDEATHERLSHLADVEASYRVAVRLLTTSPRSVQELIRRLRQRGHDPSAVAEAVGRLETQGYLDDREFARHAVRVRSQRGHGPARLLTDLLARGVERRVAERAIDEVLAAEAYDPLSEARSLAEKRLRQMGSLPAETLVRRLVGYLGRRGFRGREVVEMVRDLVRGED